jgi:pyrroline-5-carboxylate reductase
MIAKLVNCRTAKVIPSLTAEIDRSQTIVCYNSLVTDEDKTLLSGLLSSLGEVIELPENEVGMGSELVSCMPGFIASIFDVICNSAEGHTEIPKEQIVKMVLNTMSATGDLMLQKDLSFNDVVTRVATKGGITEEGTKVIYDMFPSAADEMFNKTLEKRRLTAEKAATSFEK